MDREVFEKKLANCRFIVDEKEYDKLQESVGISAGAEWITMEESNRFKEKYPSLHRDMGSKILGIVYESNGEILLKDSSDFIKDSLFCEWAYIINFKTNKFEVYESGTKLVKNYALDDLPTEKKFLKDLKD